MIYPSSDLYPSDGEAYPSFYGGWLVSTDTLWAPDTGQPWPANTDDRWEVDPGG